MLSPSLASQNQQGNHVRWHNLTGSVVNKTPYQLRWFMPRLGRPLHQLTPTVTTEQNNRTNMNNLASIPKLSTHTVTRAYDNDQSSDISWPTSVFDRSN